MSKIKLLLDVVSDLRSLADSLQAVADAVAKNGQEQPDQTMEEKPAQKPEKKSAAKKVDFEINAETVGFKAGDVYQALATAEESLSVAEIAKAAKITEQETLLGMGWLFKEGKIKAEENKIMLA